MAEPHELEERAARVIDPDAWESMIHDDTCYHCRSARDAAKTKARAVLALVRQEQEKDANAAMIDSAVLTFVRENEGIEHAPAITWRVMIRAWWLSHTAPQEK